MKPSVDDQLRQTRRILLERVLPAVESDHVADLVRRVAADLRKLATCWRAEAAFDAWEVAHLEALLVQLAPLLPSPARPAGAGGVDALRAELSAALPHLPPPTAAPEAWAAIHGYFQERLDRDPMTNRMVGASSP